MPHRPASEDAELPALRFHAELPTPLRFLAGGGRATDLIFARDWSGHPLGPPAAWPESLKVALGIVLNSPESMLLAWDAEALHLFFNETYFPLLGPRLSWAMGSPFKDVWADGWDQAKPIIDAAFAGRSTRYVDLPWKLDTDRGPADTWWTFSSSRIVDESGEVAGLFVVTKETTTWVLGEAARRAAENRNRQVLDSVTDYAIIATDLDGLVTRWNLGAERVLGWSEAEMLGQSLELIFSGADRATDRMRSEMRAAAQSGRAAEERWHQRKSGKRFRAIAETMPLRAVDGQVIGFVQILQDRTEQHRTAERLRTTEDQLLRAQEAGGIGAFAVGRDGVLYGSPQFCRLYGIALQGPCSSDLFDRLVIPEDAHLVSRGGDLDPSSASLAVEYRIRRADTGELRWIARNGDIEFDDRGRFLRFIGVARDITAEVQARDALATERERLARMFEQAPSFMALLEGPEHVIRLANPAYQRLVGDRDLIGRTLASALGAALEQECMSMLDEVFRTGRAFAANGARFAVQPTPGGPIVERFVDFVLQPVSGAAGNVTGIFIEGVDVTDRVRSEAARNEAAAALAALNTSLESEVRARTIERNTLATIVETTDVFIQVLDRDLRFLAINSANADEYQRIFGVRPRVGDSLLDLLADAPGQRVNAEALWRRALTGERFSLVADFGDPALASRYYEMSFEPLRDETGALIGAFMTGRNVTERMRSEQALREAQDALRQAQKTEAIGQLTGGLAHDFNNLLAAISGNIELLELRIARGHATGLDSYIESARAATRRAAALTQRLLAFARRQTLDPRPTDVNRLIHGIADMIGRSTGPDVELEIVGAVGLWTAKIDPSQLENSLLNLAINARDAMMPQGGRITIETANKWLDERAAIAGDLPPGQYVSVSVTDTGSGMTPEVKARAFDPFFTTKPIGAGTGLGLSMVYGFARQSGGEVRIYTEIGQGTTVSLYLPRFHGAAEPEAAIASTAVTAGAGETVLVVDDEPAIRALIVEVLRENGYVAVEAGDGHAALEWLNSHGRIDLLITDVGLPGGMSGRQIADAARQMRPALKVLFITGFAENAVLGSGLLAPGMELLTKPFEMSALARRVRNMVEPPPT